MVMHVTIDLHETSPFLLTADDVSLSELQTVSVYTLGLHISARCLGGHCETPSSLSWLYNQCQTSVRSLPSFQLKTGGKLLASHRHWPEDRFCLTRTEFKCFNLDGKAFKWRKYSVSLAPTVFTNPYLELILEKLMFCSCPTWALELVFFDLGTCFSYK